MVKELNQKLIELKNKARYVQECNNDTIVVKSMNKKELIDMLSTRNYDVLNEDTNYEYLIGMKMFMMTTDNVKDLLDKLTEVENELATLMATDIKTMWMNELVLLENEFTNFRIERENALKGIEQSVKPKTSVIKKIKAVPK